MTRNRLRVGVAASVLLVSSAAFAGANLVQNGDFSNPSTPGSGNWTQEASPWLGWSSNNNDAIEIGNSGTYGLPCDNLACQNLEVNSNTFDTVTYTVTGLTIGAKYDFDWDYGGRTSGGPDFLDVSFGGTFLTEDGGSIGTWTPNAFVVTATATSEALTFASVVTDGLPSYGNEITNVSLSGVPESSTWAMMLIGFAGLGFAGYRGSRRNVPFAA